MTEREKKVQTVADLIDELTSPVSLGEALEILEGIDAEVKSRIDAVHDDMRRSGQDWG